MLHGGGIWDGRSPEGENDGAPTLPTTAGAAAATATTTRSAPWRGRRTGRKLRSLGGDQSEEVAGSAATPLLMGPKYARLEQLSPSDKLLYSVGELLHIFRPALYAYVVFRRRMEKSWTPWVASILIELASARCTAAARQRGSNRLPSNADFGTTVRDAFERFAGIETSRGSAVAVPSADQRVIDIELQRRRMMLAFYLMRNPCFDAVTKPAVARIGNSLTRLPLIGAIGGYAVEALSYYHRNYFYISGS